MTRFINAAEEARLRAAPEDSFQHKLYQALKNRTCKNTARPGFIQPADTQEWWHLCWERASDAAFVWHMEGGKALGEWIRGVAFWMRDLDAVEWIGPWYRAHGEPYVGALETAHVCLAMCEILDLCDGLFTAEEKESLERALREKGMVPCLRYVERTMTVRRHINNWFNVILTGYGVCALYFDDQEAIEKTLRCLRDACSLYNKDSYGETVQYSNYATLTLSFLNELILRLKPEYACQVNMTCYANLMPWYAASFLYMKPWDDDVVFPRTINFGDSAAVFRPTGDVLAQVAARLKDAQPRAAHLASYLFHETYRWPEQGPDELATFGFYNQFRYHAVLMEPDMAEPGTPEEETMPLTCSFENGDVIQRDAWRDTRSVLAVKGGYAPQNVSSHKHADLGSLQYVLGRERMIVDGGHCCYRLKAQQYTESTTQHATVDFVRESDRTNFMMPDYDYQKAIGQRLVDGNFYERRPPRARNLINQYVGSVHVLSMDLSDAYPDEVKSVRRAIIAALPNAVFIVDKAETDEPLRMRSHFPVNNRDGRLNVHRADDHRFVFRRGGEAMKVFECEAYFDGVKEPSDRQFEWGYVHRNYHPLANQDGQGAEGSAKIVNWVDHRPCREHLRLCAIAGDREPRIKGWHIKPDEKGWYIESPEKEKVLRVAIRGGHAYLILPDDEVEVL